MSPERRQRRHGHRLRGRAEQRLAEQRRVGRRDPQPRQDAHDRRNVRRRDRPRRPAQRRVRVARVERVAGRVVDALVGRDRGRVEEPVERRAVASPAIGLDRAQEHRGVRHGEVERSGDRRHPPEGHQRVAVDRRRAAALRRAEQPVGVGHRATQGIGEPRDPIDAVERVDPQERHGVVAGRGIPLQLQPSACQALVDEEIDLEPGRPLRGAEILIEQGLHLGEAGPRLGDEDVHRLQRVEPVGGDVVERRDLGGGRERRRDDLALLVRQAEPARRHRGRRPAPRQQDGGKGRSDPVEQDAHLVERHVERQLAGVDEGRRHRLDHRRAARRLQALGGARQQALVDDLEVGHEGVGVGAGQPQRTDVGPAGREQESRVDRRRIGLGDAFVDDAKKVHQIGRRPEDGPARLASVIVERAEQALVARQARELPADPFAQRVGARSAEIGGADGRADGREYLHRLVADRGRAGVEVGGAVRSQPVLAGDRRHERLAGRPRDVVGGQEAASEDEFRLLDRIGDLEHAPIGEEDVAIFGCIEARPIQAVARLLPQERPASEIEPRIGAQQLPDAARGRNMVEHPHAPQVACNIWSIESARKRIVNGDYKIFGGIP